MSKVLLPNPGKVWHFILSSVSGCHILIDILLLGYFCQSINQFGVTICVINRSRILFNLITSTTSMKCKWTSIQLVYDLFSPLIRVLMEFSCSSINPTIQLGKFFYFHRCCHAHWRISQNDLVGRCKNIITSQCSHHQPSFDSFRGQHQCTRT